MYSKDSFPQQKADEQMIYFLRRHWVAVVKIIGIAIMLAAVPIAFLYLFGNAPFFQTDAGDALLVLMLSSYYLFVILFTFSNFIDYYLDVWIVTNYRVINMEQKGLFGREMAEKDLGRMQDITSEVKGFWATMLHYGDVHIQTAGEAQRFVFRQVPHAEDLTRAISNLVTEYRQRVGIQGATPQFTAMQPPLHPPSPIDRPPVLPPESDEDAV